jgi:hypothetical protein
MATITLDILDSGGTTLTSEGLLATAATIASAVSFTPTGGLSATNVQAALTELDTEKMPKTGGSFTGDVNFSGTSSSMSWDKSADQLKFNDGVKAVFGAGQALTDADLEIFHVSNQSYIRDTGSGAIFIQTDGPSITLGGTINNNVVSGKFVPGAEATLYHNSSAKITTTANGIDVTGLVEFDSLSGTGSVAITDIIDADDMSGASATTLSTSESIKAYVDAQVTLQDLDLSDGTDTISVDLDSETLSILGSTGITSTATGNGVTLAIDSTVATKDDAQTFTNKTLTSPDINTPDIDGGTIDGTTIATSDITVGAGKTLNVSAGTLTLADNQISGDKIEGGTVAAMEITSMTGTLQTANQPNITGLGTIGSLVATTADINGGTIDCTTIATSDITVGAGKTLNVSAGTLTLADNQISGDKINNGTIDTVTITNLTATSINLGGGEVSGAISVGNNKITATYTPTETVDVTNKAYVDTTAAGLGPAAFLALTAVITDTNTRYVNSAAFA